MPVLLRRATEADAKHVESLLAELGYPSKEADVRHRLRHSLRSDTSCFLLAQSASEVVGLVWPNSFHIFHAARRFAGSLVSSSRRSIVAGVSVKSFLPGRPISHANIIAQALRSPVRSIVSTRTGSTSGSDSPEPRSDSSRPYKRRATPSPRGSPLDRAATPQPAPRAVARNLFDHLVGDRESNPGFYENTPWSAQAHARLRLDFSTSASACCAPVTGNLLGSRRPI